MEMLARRSQVHGSDSLPGHAKNLLYVAGRMVRVSDDMRGLSRRAAISRLHHLLLGPHVDGEQKWNQIMDRYNHRTVKLGRWIKRAVEERQLVLLHAALEFS